MSAKILIWDSDLSLGHAIFDTLSLKGYQPVRLENPAHLAKALELEKPELAILEGNWQAGTKISLGEGAFPQPANGELSIVLPATGESSPDRNVIAGLVLGTISKPFGQDQLCVGIQTSLFLKETLERPPLPWEEYIEVRRLATEEEILADLNLRYQVYREVGFIGSRSEEIEIDRYDTRSIIFGAFHNTGGESELVGSIRITREKSEGPHAGELRRIMQRYDLDTPLSENGKPSLPALQTFGISAAQLKTISAGFGTDRSAGGKEVSPEICEMSRLVIKKEYRRRRFGIERRLYEGIVIDCSASKPHRNWFVIAVHPSNGTKYVRYGFNCLEELGVKSYAGLSQPAVLLNLDLQHYLFQPNPFTPSLAVNTLLYQVNGNIMTRVQDQPVQLEKVA